MDCRVPAFLFTLTLWILAAGGCSKRSGYDEYELPDDTKISILHDNLYELCVGFYVEIEWADGTSWPSQYFYCAEPDYSPEFEYYGDEQAVVGIAEAQDPQDILVVIDLENVHVFLSDDLSLSDEDTRTARNLVSQIQDHADDLKLHFRFEQATDEPVIGE